MTAVGIYNKYADKKTGFVSLETLKEIGWSKSKAEDEGLIIKETYVYSESR